MFQSRYIKLCDFKKKFRDGGTLDIFYFKIFRFLMTKKSLGVKFDNKLFQITAVMCVTAYIIRKKTL